MTGQGRPVSSVSVAAIPPAPLACGSFAESDRTRIPLNAIRQKLGDLWSQWCDFCVEAGLARLEEPK
ncbi:hypothetical protein Sinac_2380 [Singulisphaera acidiphila DSM 18658]|uniref:Uncharacterized protein n=1 Tax=Singulisphaera acidiphila (strain ATCC BAA-1392 / DSM 18658 / VKM B-2454 / MOB10) TaxID=886293 RepID=L0DBS1_SINAD|nr:hypothetical protein Sinac_2380 [Singulisphaera acidiphila DSM 18658]